MSNDFDPIQEFTIGEGDQELNESDRDKFKPVQDESYRLSLAWWHTIKGKDGRQVYNMDAQVPRLYKAKVGFMTGANYVLFKPGFEKYAKYIDSNTKDFEDRIATVFISWPVFRKGPNVGKTDPDLFKAERYEVLPWVFSKHKWQQILRQHNKKPLGSYDLSIHCTNAQYQYLEIGSYDNNYLRHIMESKPSMFADISGKVEKAVKRCRAMLGTNYSESDLRSKLGLVDEDPVYGEVSINSGLAFDNMIAGVLKD